MNKIWIELSFKTKRENEDLVTARLMDLGIDALNIQDDKAIFDLAQNPGKAELIDLPPGYGEYIFVNVYFEEDDYRDIYKAKIGELLKELKNQVDIDLVKEGPLESNSWATEWMKYYEILHIGHFVIVPQWKDYDAKEEDLVIRINPGLAFGTGDHPTTSMCLDFLDRQGVKGKRVLDMGTGSGILAIGAEKKGAREVVAADYDEEAIEKTKENIGLNDCKHIVPVVSDLTQNIEGKFDLAMVNIIAEVIVRLLENLDTYLNPGAPVIFTGILEEKEAMVLEALEGKYEVSEIKREDGWLAIACVCIGNL